MKLIQTTTLAALTLAVALPAYAALKVYVDYDPNYDRSRVKTFAWYKTEETSLAKKNPLMHSRLVNAMEFYLTQGGLREVEQDPDIYVTYHTNVEREFSLNPVSWGYAYPSQWEWDSYWGGYWGANTTSTVRNYNQGTLLIDIWDAETQELVWRGAAFAFVGSDPYKAEIKAYKALEKMAKKWRRIRDR